MKYWKLIKNLPLSFLVLFPISRHFSNGWYLCIPVPLTQCFPTSFALSPDADLNTATAETSFSFVLSSVRVCRHTFLLPPLLTRPVPLESFRCMCVWVCICRPCIIAKKWEAWAGTCWCLHTASSSSTLSVSSSAFSGFRHLFLIGLLGWLVGWCCSFLSVCGVCSHLLRPYVGTSCGLCRYGSCGVSIEKKVGGLVIGTGFLCGEVFIRDLALFRQEWFNWSTMRAFTTF